MIEDSRYELGDFVRAINGKTPWKVVSITFDGHQSFYDIEDYNGNIVHRVAENSLTPTKGW